MDISAEFCEPAHAKIIIVGLVAIISYLLKELYESRKGWKKRLDDSLLRQENKLDKAIENHEICQRALPEKYLTKTEFQKIFDAHLELRRKEWTEFRGDFKEFTSNFWKHRHNNGGDVERM